MHSQWKLNSKIVKLSPSQNLSLWEIVDSTPAITNCYLQENLLF